MDLHAYHTQGLCAGVDVVQAWLYCFQIPTELLVNALVTLGYNLIGIVNKTTANAGHPCSHAATYFAPAHHATSIEWDLLCRIVHFGKMNMFRFSVESFAFLNHFDLLSI